MKKIITLGFALIMALALSGCMRADTGLQVSEDNNITAHAKIWIDKSQIDAMGDALGSTSDKNDVKVETINGKEYYVEEETKIFTQKGSNIITVATEIEPSNIQVKYIEK